jgi:amino acid permease
MWTAMSHVVTILIGSGVLAMAWSFAQLGWVGSPVVLVFFFGLTYYTSTLLADCYRHPDPVTGAINKEYIEAVGCYLGMKHQIANLIVIIIISATLIIFVKFQLQGNVAYSGVAACNTSIFGQPCWVTPSRQATA